MRVLSTLVTLLLLMPFTCSVQAQQLTRKQLLQKFVQATQYHNAGQDSLAIAKLEEVAEIMPNFAATYRREAEIYADMSSKGDELALNGAVLMYRRYLTLELDDEKTREARARLKELEDKLHVAHFEDTQLEQSKQEAKQDNALATIDDDAEDLQSFVMSVSQRAESNVASIRPSGGRRAVRSIPSAKNVTAATPASGAEQVPVAAESLKNELPAVAQETPAAQTANTGAQPRGEEKAASQSGKGFSYLSYYDLKMPQLVTGNTDQQLNMNIQSLEGHWVSSLANTDGREYWIIDIQSFGSDYSVSLSPIAGVTNPVEDKNLYNRALKMLRSYNLLSDESVKITETEADGRVNGNHLLFKFKSEKNHEPNSSVYKWTNQLLSNVAPALPFGNIIQKVGETVTNALSENDVHVTYSYDMNFDCHLTSEGVMECEYLSKGKQVSTKGTKSLAAKKKSFTFYRTAADYEYFRPETIEPEEENLQALFDDVCARIEVNPTAYYALALLYHYGVGCEVDDKKAVEFMTLATNTTCAEKAIGWLVKHYKEEATDDNMLSFWTKRKYSKMSQLWLQELKNRNMPSYYGLKADIMLDDEDKSKNDSAIFFFRDGAKVGDPYSTYRFAMLLMGRRDFNQAMELLQKAGDNGEPDAYLYIALAKRDGNGVAVDPKGFLDYLSKAIDGGSVQALRVLSDAYLQGSYIRRNFVEGNVIRNYWMQSTQNQWLDDLYALGFDIDQVK